MVLKLEKCGDGTMPEMTTSDLHSEYPTDAQIEEMWAAYKSSGCEGILAFLRQRTAELQETESEITRGRTSRLKELTEG